MLFRSAWEAFVDGNSVAGMFDPLDITVGAIESGGESDAFGVGLGPAEALSNISVVATFTLTPGAQMSLTSVFNIVVPAPGAALGLAGVGDEVAADRAEDRAVIALRAAAGGEDGEAEHRRRGDLGVVRQE